MAHVVFVPTLAVLAALSIALSACGSDGSSDATPTAGGTDGPGAFEAARADLRDDLKNYGANIGSLPDDIRTAVLDSCWELGDYASDSDVQDICTAVERAIDTADPGLIDLILNELDALAVE